MKRILEIGHVTLRLFFKSKASYIWLFGVPTALIYFLASAAREPGDPANRRAPLAIDNRDTNFLSQIFVAVLTNQGIAAVGPTNAPRAVRIPPDFTSQIVSGGKTAVAFSEHNDVNEGDAALAKLRVARALVAMNSALLQAAAQPGGLTNLSENRLRTILNKPEPTRLKAYYAGRKPTPTGFNFSLPGNIVMYLLFNLLIFGGANTAAGRRDGTLRRLATTQATRLEIVLGKIYGNTLLGGAQILYFLLIGRFIFKVNLGANLPGVLMILVALAWAAAGLGVLAGSCIISEDRIVPVCVLTGLLIGALGGCWWPLEAAPPIFQKIAMGLPSGWALGGLHQMISFGSGIGAAVKPTLMLAGFGVVANGLAVRFFRV